jgi:hypothetical protein
MLVGSVLVIDKVTLILTVTHPRLDDKPYVYMMCDNTSQNNTIMHIHVSRLEIRDRRDETKNK